MEHIQSGMKARGQEVGPEWHDSMYFYFSNPGSVYATGETIRAPGNTKKLDYELEVAAVIGLPGAELHPEAAERHIAGYCVYNDWSARDLIDPAPGGAGKAKDFAQTLGPYLVTPDELESRRKGRAFDLTMTAGVNDREYSRGNLAEIFWSFGEMLAYASRGVELRAGDVVGTGTVGKGCILEWWRIDPDRYPWLVEGDEVYLEVEVLGRIVNSVAFGPETIPLPQRT
jgi:2-keto-4-pentenoate hydratase/2-oxohepta-3-ene-1,7-dioic acid hydratase in catechol pathway